MSSPHKRKGYIGIISGLAYTLTGLMLEQVFFPVSITCIIVGIILTFWGLKNFWKHLSIEHKHRKELQEGILEKYREIEKTIQEILSSGTYLIFPKKSSISLKIKMLQLEIDKLAKDRMIDEIFSGKITSGLQSDLQSIEGYNPNFISQRKKDYSSLWQKGNISLDDEQQTSIVTDDNYNLVIAGAGSGKTEVLITRIAYLIKRKPDTLQPNRILAIAFQRKAMEQMEERLNQRYGINNVDVKTFHKLGKDILASSGKVFEKSDIINDNKKSSYIAFLFENNMQPDSEMYKLFVRYVKNLNNKEEATDSDKREAANYAKERRYVSLNGTKVNSIAEKEIMDYFLTHKIGDKAIEVVYEPSLEGFNPDFYLPQLGVFIEHWGINKDGNVPLRFNQSSDEYKANMEKKKQWFKTNGKLLVETFSYEFNPNDPDIFCELLITKIEKSVKKPLLFKKLSYEEILELVWQSQKTPVEDIQNFITTAKTYGLYPDDIDKRLKESRWSNKQLAFGHLALFVFRAYENQVKMSEKLDFEDMINRAIQALVDDPNLCKNIYDQILIDEYQDISSQRFNLLKILLDRNFGCKLFCVGDDWQSIMGFSGSNLKFFVNFDSYFPNPAITRISTNYRSIKSIVDAGNELIKKNGIKQMQKIVLANRAEVNPILIMFSPHQDGYDKQYFKQIADDCLKRIMYYLNNGYYPSDILVLTRFMRAKTLGRRNYFKVVKTFSLMAKDAGLKLAIDNAKDPNAVRLLTVHKCKGLEAKVVFVLNVVKGEFGFPSEIEDSSILEVARGDNGVEKQIEEERRLFYVALTRAKDFLYIYTRENSKSAFIAEISESPLAYIRNLRLDY
jgi:DNA helicase IV